ncbi:MerR family transcriptional regulator [Deinococcus metallilatus]|uniref:DNA-binding transcriptional MerR regulator n=1 Tax=Deinococcus metallilatus TaxID=1211322 RepID=A0AAJ5F5P2_9DEIO|nr:MerR family transcriptional regulator [Deinococcus metallilatus]MBB5296387.1 DNA-binding transcriptional MerR regulator [Deinococcus metallilatus]QBY09938.1 MerR family transcriptional regulator [Deinococcus metallilatus]RXJ08662.1 MerR family transcriptional regulator [Deinococcus metallilatus]TLK25136.1 MerR family transcriptional regulator [Deinococcus metallilatus]GMA14700.1 MerR family transcriptional regulator [Deinococcus metallilatus]
MTDTEATLTIGAFSRASRLSLKALRLYDDLGLLPPARVDEGTGYRYYTPSQLGTAHLIGLLRQLDLPLSEVRAVLDTPAQTRASQLTQLWARVEREHGRRRGVAQYLIEKLQGETDMTDHFDVQQRLVPAQRVATLTRRLYVADLTDFIGEAGGRLHALTGAQTAGATFVIYHGEVNADSDGPVEVCVPFTGSLTVPDDVTVREEPAHHEAYVTLTRAQFVFPDILRAYDATCEYAKAHGTPGELSPREVYPVAWDGLSDNDPAGDVAWPFVPRG